MQRQKKKTPPEKSILRKNSSENHRTRGDPTLTLAKQNPI